jgi:glycosyltransferase involved in cell wall biosynthesis
MSKKDFSIVIPYYNKAYEINLVLKSLSLQNYDKTKYEVVIIDDGSDQRIDDIVKKYDSIMDINYIYIEHTGNRGKNRNLGVKESRGERIIFLDSDIVAERNMIKEFDRETKDDKKFISVGMRNLLYNYDKNYLDEKMLEYNFDLFKNFPSRKDPRITEIIYEEESGNKMDGKWQLVYTNCLCLWKKEFDEVNGFDEIFSKNWGAEDVELGYRLYRNGCKIDINQKVETYHLYHPEDFIKRIESLKKNYVIFVNKHPHWQVELFIREYETWAIEMIELQEKIKKREYIVSDIKNVKEFLNTIPGNSLLCGIENEELLFSDKIETAFLPESSINNAKIMNIIGIKTYFNDQHFDLAIVSKEYEYLNYGVFVMLIKELERIAKRIIFINKESEIIEKLYDNKLNYSNSMLHKKNLLFMISNIFSLEINKYFMINLAIACYNRGIITGINMQYDPFHKIDINSDFMYFNDKSKREILNKLIYHELNFIGDQIPCIIDRTVAKSTYRSLGNRMLWNEVYYYNEDKEYKKEILRVVDKVLLKRECDRDKLLLNDTSKMYYLPVGIDKKIINIMGKKSKHKRGKEFVFYWCDKSTGNDSNLEQLIECFTEIFKNNNNVKLKINFTGNNFFYIGNEVTSEAMNQFNASTINYRKMIFNCYFKELIEKYKKNRSIIVQYGKESEEEILSDLIDSDCYININSRMVISPLILYSIAFGKKSIILDNDTYNGYGKSKNYLKVKCYKNPVVLSEPLFVQAAKLETKDYRRYCMSDKPDKESLKNILLYAYKNRDDLMIDQNDKNDFIEKHDWEEIVNKLISII